MSRPPDTDEPLPVRWLAVAVAVVGALALLGVLAAWPRGEAPDLGVQPTTYVDAEVTGVENGTCPEIEVEALGDCRIVSVRLSSGDAAGTDASFQVLSTQFEVPDLDTGDDVVLLDVATSPGEFRYSFVDFQRRTPLVGLGEGVRFTDIPDLREEQPGHWVAPVPVGTVIEGGRS